MWARGDGVAPDLDEPVASFGISLIPASHPMATSVCQHPDATLFAGVARGQTWDFLPADQVAQFISIYT